MGRENSIQVVSGAATGIDEISITEAAGNGGTAIGIVADNLLRLATHRSFRQHIIQERMALVTTFDPGAGFSLGRAMGRNRLIYALADRAIVACSENSGGTWAGALEAMGVVCQFMSRLATQIDPGMKP